MGWLSIEQSNRKRAKGLRGTKGSTETQEKINQRLQLNHIPTNSTVRRNEAKAKPREKQRERGDI